MNACTDCGKELPKGQTFHFCREGSGDASRNGAREPSNTCEDDSREVVAPAVRPGAIHEKHSDLGRVATTCIEHAYGTTTRLSFQVKVF